MKRAILGLAALVASSCASTSKEIVMRGYKPHDEIVIEKYVEVCLNFPGGYALYVTPLGSEPHFSEIAHVDDVLKEKTDCHLSVYFDRRQRNLKYILERGDPQFFVETFFPEPEYARIYPYNSDKE